MNRRSIILITTVHGLTPVLLLFSLFLTFHGHNAPGGGFSGGLVMGIAVVLRYLAVGPEGVRSIRVDPIALMGVGLLTAIVTGLTPLLFGEDFLESAIWKLDLPLIGEVKFVSAAIFDIGVHILVFGVVLAILFSLVEADDEAIRASDASGALPQGDRP